VSSLTDHQILIFLLQILCLLFVSKLLGEFAKKLGAPPLVGEILAGIILCASVLGRFMPDLYNTVFPVNPVQDSMLDTMALMGILFLLLTTGFEVNVSTLWSQRGSTLKIGMIGGTLLMAYAVSVSGTPIISKIMHDLKILKTDVGLTIILAYVVNEVMGWFLFTLVLVSSPVFWLVRCSLWLSG